MHKDIGGFEVSMCDAHLFEILKSLVYIQDNFVKLPFRQWFPLFDSIIQVSLVAQFCDDVAIPI
jgi:hypothetical protein